MRRLARWFFAAEPDHCSSWDVLGWWEARRIPFNAIVGAWGGLCFVVFFWAIATSRYLEPGEDAVEPIALLAAPVAINVLYTLRWLVEVPARLLVPGLSPRFGPALLKLGLWFGLSLITLPAAVWGGYRLLQVVGALS